MRRTGIAAHQRAHFRDVSDDDRLLAEPEPHLFALSELLPDLAERYYMGWPERYFGVAIKREIAIWRLRRSWKGARCRAGADRAPRTGSPALARIMANVCVHGPLLSPGVAAGHH